MSIESVLLANAFLIVSMGVLAQVHATSAAMKRLAPGPRWRIILLTFMLLGAAGLSISVLSRWSAVLLELTILG